MLLLQPKFLKKRERPRFIVTGYNINRKFTQQLNKFFYWTGNNLVGHNIVGHNLVGHNLVGHNLVGHGRT